MISIFFMFRRSTQVNKELQDLEEFRVKWLTSEEKINVSGLI